MPAIVLIIFAICACLLIVDETIKDVWGQLLAMGTEGEISVEVTGIEVENDAVVVTTVVTNDDWRSHPVCIETYAVLTGYGREVSVGIYPGWSTDPIAFYKNGDTSSSGGFWICDDGPISVGGHSSQTVVSRFSSRSDDMSMLIDAMRRGAYGEYETCVYIEAVEGVPYRGIDGYRGLHCVSISGPQ